MSLFLRRRILTGGFVPITATGGNFVFDKTDAGVLYRVHVFTTSGTFAIQDAGTETTVDAFLVGGGGGGGNSRGGGGGAGGLVFRPGLGIEQTSYLATVGSPGLHIEDANPGTDGGNSSLGGLLTALGGGGGGAVSGSSDPNDFNGNDGGSGGGARRGDERNTFGGTGLQPTAAGDSGSPFGFGNDGANSNPNDDSAGGGGSGGAGTTVPRDGTTTVNGGPGLAAVTVSGITYNFASMFTTEFGEVSSGQAFFAGGGGGQDMLGGLGGGGTGSSTGSARAGLPNTGGGGGGDRTDEGTNGGSGIVIIRYPLQEVA